jgi:hypothetical protein
MLENKKFFFDHEHFDHDDEDFENLQKLITFPKLILSSKNLGFAKLF